MTSRSYEGLSRSYDAFIPALSLFERSAIDPSIDPESARKQASRWIRVVSLPEPQGVGTESIHLRHGGGWKTFRPGNPRPGIEIFYVHGGGLVFFDVDDYAGFLQHVAELSGTRVTAFEYPKAPESSYAQIFDSLYRDMSRRIAALDRGSRVVLAADSMGVYLSLHIALRTRSMPFERLILINPVLDVEKEWASYQRYGSGLPLTANSMEWFRRLCRHNDGTAPFDPFGFRDSDYRNLPPICVHSAEFDVLRDEAFAWCDLLRRHGVSLDHRHYPDLAHDFCLYAGKVPEAYRAIEAIAAHCALTDSDKPPDASTGTTRLLTAPSSPDAVEDGDFRRRSAFKAARYDVAIVGGSVAGCICALRLARCGLKVAVLERRSSREAYKRLCTHFIQPIALKVLRSLGLDELIESHAGLRTRAVFWTPDAVIDPSGDYTSDPESRYAYNIERRVLDPLLREKVSKEPSIDLIMGATLRGLDRDRGGWQLTVSYAAEEHTLSATNVIAADGRSSSVARAIGNTGIRHENDRCAYFSYFRGVTTRHGNRSLFMRIEQDMAFVYPLAEDISLLALYQPKTESYGWSESCASERLLAYFSKHADVIDVSRATETAHGLGYKDYPSIVRQPVHEDIAFIGDAALTLDPMSGVGCAFAVVAADMLARCGEESLESRTGWDAALVAYSQAFTRFFKPHIDGIIADSKVVSSANARADVYRRIASNEELARSFIALTGRLITPSAFQYAYITHAAKAKECTSEPTSDAL